MHVPTRPTAPDLPLLRVWFQGMAHHVPCERGRPVSFGSAPLREPVIKGGGIAAVRAERVRIAKDTILGRSMARA